MYLLDAVNLKVNYKLKRHSFLERPSTLRAVDGVNLRISHGQTVALVGESGCGKSSVARAILGIIETTEGEIFFEGTDLAALDKNARKEVWSQMQVVSQDPVSALNPRLSVGRAIGEPMQISGFPKQQIENRTRDLMTMVGLNPDLLGRSPQALSGGQRQRVVIARALTMSPKLVVCDEPVSALDVSIQSQILNLLARLQKELGLSYLFISHDLSVVRHISDMVKVMYLGVIVEEGPTADIFAKSCHPYTQALISAIPIPDPDRRKIYKEPVIPGELPNAIEPPKGCPYVSRCTIAESQCASKRPPLVEIDPNHFIRCHVRSRH